MAAFFLVGRGVAVAGPGVPRSAQVNRIVSYEGIAVGVKVVDGSRVRRVNIIIVEVNQIFLSLETRGTNEREDESWHWSSVFGQGIPERIVSLRGIRAAGLRLRERGMLVVQFLVFVLSCYGSLFVLGCVCWVLWSAVFWVVVLSFVARGWCWFCGLSCR